MKKLSLCVLLLTAFANGAYAENVVSGRREAVSAAQAQGQAQANQSEFEKLIPSDFRAASSCSCQVNASKCSVSCNDGKKAVCESPGGQCVCECR